MDLQNPGVSMTMTPKSRQANLRDHINPPRTSDMLEHRRRQASGKRRSSKGVV